MIDQESLASIENLHRMKSDGIITEADFEQAKQKILFGSKPMKTAAAPVAQPADDDVMTWLKLSFQRYNDFTGRSGRREFWLFQLLPAAIGVIIVLAAGGGGEPTGFSAMVTILAVLALLAMALPQIALQIRRFHDQDRSGWHVLINFIPYAGPVIVLVMMLLEGTNGDNRYGSDPTPR